MTVDTGRVRELVVVGLTIMIIGTMAGCGQDPLDPAYIHIAANESPPTDATIIEYNRSPLDADRLERGFRDTSGDGVTIVNTSADAWFAIRDQFRRLPTVENKSSGIYYVEYAGVTYEILFAVQG